MIAIYLIYVLTSGCLAEQLYWVKTFESFWQSVNDTEVGVYFNITAIYRDYSALEIYCGQVCDDLCQCQHYTYDFSSGCILSVEQWTAPPLFTELTYPLNKDTHRLIYMKTLASEENFAYSTYSYSLYTNNQWPDVADNIVYTGNVALYNVKSYNLTMKFATHAEDGVMFYANPSPLSHLSDIIGAYFKDGKLHHIIDNHRGPGIAVSTLLYNDGQWHTAVFTKSKDNVGLCVDGQCTDDSAVSSGGVATNEGKYYIGGAPHKYKDDLHSRMGVSSSFMGCIKHITVNGQEVGAPAETVNTHNCCQ